MFVHMCVHVVREITWDTASAQQREDDAVCQQAASTYMGNRTQRGLSLALSLSRTHTHSLADVHAVSSTCAVRLRAQARTRAHTHTHTEAHARACSHTLADWLARSVYGTQRDRARGNASEEEDEETKKLSTRITPPESWPAEPWTDWDGVWG